VVLFLLDLYNATGEELYLDAARSGADALMAELQAVSDLQPGLYTGLAGMVFCLADMYRVSKDPRYHAAASRGLDALLQAAQPVGAGVEWNPVTDIIGGSSGIGLTLLNVAPTLGGTDSLDVAAAAGHRLMELGRPTSNGIKWPMSPDYHRLMPNFSHGTAGVSYYLATLHQQTGDERFLAAAVAGARYLQSVAVTGDGDICLVFHNEPDGEDLYYLSWCHGPVGTARLFYRLASITRDDEWLQWANMCARGIMQSGIPEQRTPGFWNNVSQCCGDAGVGEFFASMYRVTGDQTYQDFLYRIRASVVDRATEDDTGIRWLQAEHRTRPELIVAQTGFMQGAAGMATFLLHLDALEQGRESIVVLPDSPFTV
jgi:lantibiotic modifying enzyme